MMNQHLGVTQDTREPRSTRRKKIEGLMLVESTSLSRQFEAQPDDFIYVSDEMGTPLVLSSFVRASHYTANASPWRSIFNAGARFFNKRLMHNDTGTSSACAVEPRKGQKCMSAGALIFYTPHILIQEHPPLHIVHSDFHLWGERKKIEGDNFVSERET